jgi:hypothetical protein
MEPVLPRPRIRRFMRKPFTAECAEYAEKIFVKMLAPQLGFLSALCVLGG